MRGAVRNKEKVRKVLHAYPISQYLRGGARLAAALQAPAGNCSGKLWQTLARAAAAGGNARRACVQCVGGTMDVERDHESALSRSEAPDAHMTDRKQMRAGCKLVLEYPPEH